MADRAHDPIARLPSGDTLANALDHAGDLATRRERAIGLELVFVLDDQDVGKVDRAGLDRDDDLSGTGYQIGQLDHFQSFRSADRPR